MKRDSTNVRDTDNKSIVTPRRILKKWDDDCEYCGNADDECSMCHDEYQYEPSECPHGEDHATWYYRYADHEAGTVSIEYDCGLCGEHNVVARVEPLSDGERDWNDRAKMYRTLLDEIGHPSHKIAHLTLKWLERVTSEVAS